MQKSRTDANEDLPIWTIDSSEYIVSDRFLKLRADNCTTPQGGKVNKFYVLEYGDWVNCIAIDEEDNAVMLRHYRHGVQKYLMEFIGGGIETTDASPEAAAKRELEEETGYTGGTLFHVGTSYPNPANHTNKVHTFLAVGGKISQDKNLEVGETIHVEKILFKTVIEEMSKPGTIYPALYITALFHAINFIRASNDPSLEHLKKYV
ncbi:MAG TPA: NUDIX hydrolase [Candidatus Saccharimonadales bacterium]|nr:NUDIX hydrolase [Candidatus Saccharimonadales bacterium]